MVLALIIWLIRTGQKNAATFSAAYGLVLLLFFVTSKQAFLNYYLLIASALFLAVASLPLTKLNRAQDVIGEGLPVRASSPS
jgi:hypothetical protein